uniref:Uncharacterized protein n=1 Tax=Catharus ustulatus TaxID=91951 RepID=A0A8C3TZ23_CATUS
TAGFRPWRTPAPAPAPAQESLDLTCRRTPCFVKFSEMEEMVNMEAEINEVQHLTLKLLCKRC